MGKIPSYKEFVAERPQETDLNVERARRFFRTLADEPFLCIVVTEDDAVRIFSKGLEKDHIDRIREVLREVQGHGAEG